MELKTTTNQGDKRIIIKFITPLDGGDNVLAFMCTDVYTNTWNYVITNCMANYWPPYKYMTGVPSDQIKVWQITRTQTNLLVVCNGVTVLDYNFATDYRDGRSNCHNKWTRRSTSIAFQGSLYGNNGHLFMRTVTHG